MCANFGDPRSREHKKTAILVWKFINLLIIQKPLDVQSRNLYTMWVLKNVYANWVWGRLVTWPKFYRLKMGKKLTNLNWCIPYINYRYWWKMVCDFLAHYQPSFFCSFTPTWILFSFSFFSFFLFFSSYLTFKLQNALYSKFERLKRSRRAGTRMNLGGGTLGVSPSIWYSKILNF